MGKVVLNSKDGRDSLLAGAQKAFDLIAPTLGAAGRNVAIRLPDRSVYVTKDGINSLKQLVLSDPGEDMGNQLIRAASEKTSMDAGDATTTTVVLAYQILNNAIRAIEVYHPVKVLAGMEKAVSVVTEKIKEISIPVDDEKIDHVSIISANNDKELGLMIASLMKEIGKDGMVVINDSSTGETHYEVANGLTLDSGWSTPYLINNQRKGTCELNNVAVLVTDEELYKIDQVEPFLNFLIQTKRHGLIVCTGFGGEALGVSVSNVQRNVFSLGVVLAPGRGSLGLDVLEDVAIYCGANLVTENKGTECSKLDLHDLGKINQAIIGKDKSLLIGGAGDTKERIEALKEAAKDSKEAKQRLANMTGKTSVFFVWGDTTVELVERKDRVDDAIHAVGSAIEEGVVPGGGACLYTIAKEMKDMEFKEEAFKAGFEVIRDAIKLPIKTILHNSGKTKDEILSILHGIGEHGYDVAQDKFVDMVEAGIIDPAKSVRVSLVNAYSVVKTVLSTENVMFDEIPKR